MKKLTYISILVLFLAAFFGLPGKVSADSGKPDDKVIFGGSFTLESGEKLDGSLIIFGGAVSLEEDSVVKGDVVLTGGSLDVAGQIDGSITAIGGAVTLGDEAFVRGDINSIGAVLKKADGATVKGNISNQSQGDLRLPTAPPTKLPAIAGFDFDPIGKALWAFFEAIVVAAIAILVTMFAPKPVERVGRAVVGEPVQTGLFGLLTAVVAPGLVLILVITILLIPLALIGALILGLAVLFGWIAIGLEVGKKIAEMFKANWALPVSAGIGTLVLSLVIAAAEVIPCIGWLFPSALAVFAMGAVLTTRFGTRWATPWSASGYTTAAPVEKPVQPAAAQTLAAGPEVPPDEPAGQA
jgi:hypothetical protein